MELRPHFASKGLSSQNYGFSSSHIWMWELDYKESWALKNWCFWTVVLEKTLESPLDCKEIQPVHPKGNQSWILIGRPDVEAQALVLWPPDAKSWLIKKDPDAGKDWRQKEKGTTEDEMIGWHHQPNGLQHTRLPCPSPTPRACSNSCPSSQWCHPTISSSAIPFSSCLQSFPASGSFQMSQFFTSSGQSIRASPSASFLPMNIQDWFPLGLTGWISLLSKRLSRVFSNTTVQKHQFFGAQLFL